jgi:guanyl-specific ribonuclease Sa
MPLVAVLVVAAAGMAVSGAFIGTTTESRELSAVSSAPTAPVARSDRRGTRAAGDLIQAEAMPSFSDAPRRGMRTSPESLQRAPLESAGEWTRRGTKNLTAG